MLFGVFLAAAPKLVSPLDDGFLLRFLRAQKFDYEKAFAMVCFPTKYIGWKSFPNN